MRSSTINKLCCPFDKGELELTIVSQDIQENVLEGFFNCHICKRIYPIIKGIPIMNPDEYREFSLEQPLINRWQKFLKGKEFNNFRLEEKSQGEN